MATGESYDRHKAAASSSAAQAHSEFSPPRRYTALFRQGGRAASGQRSMVPLVALAGIGLGAVMSWWITAPDAAAGGGAPLAQQSAAPIAARDDRKFESSHLALVLAGYGEDPVLDKRLLSLHVPVVLAMRSIVPAGSQKIARAREAGFDVVLQIPFDQQNGPQAPNAILPDLSVEEATRRLALHLDAVSGYEAVIPQGGEQATRSGSLMKPVMAELARRNLIFIDPRHSNYSVAAELAMRLQVPVLRNYWFLRPTSEAPLIRRDLGNAAQDARSFGASLAFGKASPIMLDALEDWLATRSDDPALRGLKIVGLDGIIPALYKRHHASE
ncbi:MAG: divergent polysaccharide deacetylase family protein [Neomegalonema sp.]|nr:divergent polysaccharide deacetylase family protein [Neomegalonema sp.]